MCYDNHAAAEDARVMIEDNSHRCQRISLPLSSESSEPLTDIILFKYVLVYMATKNSEQAIKHAPQN